MGDRIDPQFDDQSAHAGSYPPDWDARRRATYQRDDYTCQNCGATGGRQARGNGAVLHAHHIVPRSRGGSNALSNLQTLCESCHNNVHDHDITATTATTANHGDSSSGRTPPTDPEKVHGAHILLDLTWLVLILVLGLVIGSVVTFVGLIVGVSPHVMAVVVLALVFLIGLYLFGSRRAIEPMGPTLFVVPAVLLGLTLYAVLEGARIDFFMGVITVFGSVSLASRTYWFVAGHWPSLSALSGPLLFALTSTALIGTLAWPVGETLALASVGGFSAAILTTPVGMATGISAVSGAFILLVLANRFSARVLSS